MADTMQLPGVGKVNKTYVYAGGAAVAGIVGYAWWTRSRRPAAPVYDVDSVGETDYRPPMGGGGNSSYTGQQPEGINSNIQWAQKAVALLEQSGTDLGLAGIAVTRFLARQPLSPNEERAITSIYAMLGEPPEGRPWKIIPQAQPDRLKAPDLSRYPAIPGSPFFFIVAREGESWENLVSRGYGGLSPHSQNFTQVVTAGKDINNHITTPKAGDLIALR